MRPPMRSGFAGRGGGSGGRGRGRGGRSPPGRGGPRGGGGRSFQRDEGPPAEIIEAGQVAHDCESELVCQWTIPDKVPYFNAGVFLENKRKIGKVDEIFGKVSDIFFTIKMDPGVISKSFQPKDLVYIGTDKLLPLGRFTDPGKPAAGRSRGGARASPGRGRFPAGGPARGRFAGRSFGGRSPAGRPGRGASFGRGRR